MTTSTLLRNAVLIASFILARTSFALTDDASRVFIPMPVFVEQTNGLFRVGHLDTQRNVIQLWKEVFIRRDQLSTPCRISQREIIFARGAKPPFANREERWNPTDEQRYYYGKIPYEIEEIEPELMSYLDPGVSCLLGFYLRGWFYAVTNLGLSASSEVGSMRNIKADFFSGSRYANVVAIIPPSHRAVEIQSAADLLMKSVRRKEGRPGINPDR